MNKKATTQDDCYETHYYHNKMRFISFLRNTQWVKVRGGFKGSRGVATQFYFGKKGVTV